MLISLQLFASDTTSTTKQIVAWDGEKTNKGSGWTNPETSCTIGQQTFESHSGKTALEFKFKSASGIWLGAGWDWAVMHVGPYGIDITDMTNFTFWLKVKGKTSEFSLNLLCNGEPALDQPQHHTEKVIISSYCPE